MSTTAATIITTVIFTEPKRDSSYFGGTTLVTWTNIGPLTTTFTAPASCSDIQLGNLIVSGRHNNELIFSEACSVNRDRAPFWLECQPSGSILSSIWPYASVYRAPYMSPGLFCPSGYSTASVLTLESSDVFSSMLDKYLVPTVGTHVFCCPRYAACTC